MTFFKKSIQKNTSILENKRTDTEQTLLSIYIKDILLSGDINEFLKLCRQSNYSPVLFPMLDSCWNLIEADFDRSKQSNSSDYYDSLYTFTLCRLSLLEESIRTIITTNNKLLFRILIEKEAFSHLTQEQLNTTLNDIWLELEDKYLLNNDIDIARYKKEYHMIEYMKQILNQTSYETNDIRHLQHIHWLK